MKNIKLMLIAAVLVLTAVACSNVDFVGNIEFPLSTSSFEQATAVSTSTAAISINFIIIIFRKNN